MTTQSEQAATVPGPTGGIHGEWLTLLEHLLGAVVHATNNAITALTMHCELSTASGEILDQSLLTREFARIQKMVEVTGLLSGRSSSSEALELRAVLDVAVRLHGELRHLRDVECEIRQTGPLLPVRVPRTELLRVLLLMIDAAKRSHSDETTRWIELASYADRLTVRVPSEAEPGEDMRAFAESCGGIARQREGALELELPSLAALRQRERAS